MKKLSMFVLTVFVCSGALFAQDSTITTTKSTHSTTAKTHKAGHDNMSHGKMSHMKMKDCVMMKGGKMMVMKGGEKMEMESETSFSNGSKVGTDGMLTKKDGTTKQLKNGDCVYMDGKMVGKMKKSGMHRKTSMHKKVKTETTTTTTTPQQAGIYFKCNYRSLVNSSGFFVG